MKIESEPSQPTFTYETDPDKIKTFVLKILSIEADDISKETIESLYWRLEEIPLSKITVDEAMIMRHEYDPVHIKRAEHIEQAVRDTIPLPPLIAMYENNFLVDGYTRYRVYKKLKITTIQVYLGK